MKSVRIVVQAVLELGQNIVLAVALISFGVSANLTPSILSSVSTWGLIGNAALILGAAWALLALAWYGSSVMTAFSERKRPWIFQILSFALGSFIVIAAVTVMAGWAANNAAMRYCTGKPSAQDVERCSPAFNIP